LENGPRQFLYSGKVDHDQGMIAQFRITNTPVSEFSVLDIAPESWLSFVIFSLTLLQVHRRRTKVGMPKEFARMKPNVWVI
jgi:hypothetical protein